MTKREIWGWQEDGRDNGYVGWKNSDPNWLVQSWKNEFNLSKWWLIGSYARFYPCIKIVKQVLKCMIRWFGILAFQKKWSVKWRMDVILKGIYGTCKEGQPSPQHVVWGSSFWALHFVVKQKAHSVLLGKCIQVFCASISSSVKWAIINSGGNFRSIVKFMDTA